jgi:hypothetical protein
MIKEVAASVNLGKDSIIVVQHTVFSCVEVWDETWSDRGSASDGGKIFLLKKSN